MNFNESPNQDDEALLGNKRQQEISYGTIKEESSDPEDPKRHFIKRLKENLEKSKDKEVVHQDNYIANNWINWNIDYFHGCNLNICLMVVAAMYIVH